jgi:AcrR family transcriptional regulator
MSTPRAIKVKATRLPQAARVSQAAQAPQTRRASQAARAPQTAQASQAAARPAQSARAAQAAPAPLVATTAPPSPWRARRERLHDRAVKREAVIRAAARAFNQKGYHNTSLDDIAAALEVTKPTVYYYVSNKEQLLFECFLAGVEQIRTAFRDVKSRDLTARERLNAVLHHYAQAVASDFGWCMVRTEDLDLSPAMSGHIKVLKSEIDHGIRRLIREGIQEGSIHPCDPKMAAFALAGALNWIAHWFRENQSMTRAQIADAFVTIFENGLLPRAPAQKTQSTRKRRR